MTAEFHWDDARIFLAIARAGTLSGAADKMNMGIATVSRRLDRLEQALNVPLFSRHQSGYRLTDDGEALLARAEALEYAGLAFGEAAQLQGHVAGVVRLATSDNLATHFILPSLKGLLDHYPELRVEVLSGVQPVNLHRRGADLAIRMVKPEAGHLTLKRLGTVGFGVYGAADCLVGADGLSLSEADFVGIIDLVRMKAEVYYDNEGVDIREEEIPEHMRADAERYRAELLDAIADADDEMMEKYLDEGDLSPEDMIACIRKKTIANELGPVCCGTS